MEHHHLKREKRNLVSALAGCYDCVEILEAQKEEYKIDGEIDQCTRCKNAQDASGSVLLPFDTRDLDEDKFLVGWAQRGLGMADEAIVAPVAISVSQSWVTAGTELRLRGTGSWEGWAYWMWEFFKWEIDNLFLTGKDKWYEWG